jgi:hypothetical protein
MKNNNFFSLNYILFGVLASTIFNYLKLFFELEKFDYIIYFHVTILCIIDTFLGSFLAIQNKNFSFKNFSVFLKKLILISLTFITIHSIKIINFHYKNSLFEDILDFSYSTIYFTLILNEFISIMGNLSKLGIVNHDFLKNTKFFKFFEINEEKKPDNNNSESN